MRLSFSLLLFGVLAAGCAGPTRGIEVSSTHPASPDAAETPPQPTPSILQPPAPVTPPPAASTAPQAVPPATEATTPATTPPSAPAAGTGHEHHHGQGQ